MNDKASIDPGTPSSVSKSAGQALVDVRDVADGMPWPCQRIESDNPQDELAIVLARKSEERGSSVDVGAISFHMVNLPVVSGHEIWTTTDARWEGMLEPGHLNLVPRGQAWGNTLTEHGCEAINICVPSSLLDRVAAEHGLNPDRVELVPQLGAKDLQLLRVAQLLQHRLETPDFGQRLVIDSMMEVTVAHLLGHHATISPGAKQNTGRLTHAEFGRVRDYVEAHLGDDISLRELADAACLSTCHFARQFKRTAGMTPHQYLVKRRIERAKSMLVDPAFSECGIATIASACGFTDQSHLGRHFKKHVGITPAAFRRSAS